MFDDRPEQIYVDGVLQLDATERDLVHEHFTVDTRDHEDHTFCGVMLLLIFFFVRVCPVPLVILSLVDASEHFLNLPGYIQLITKITFPIPAAMNILWFYQIISVAMKGCPSPKLNKAA